MTLRAARTILRNPRAHSRARLINASIFVMSCLHLSPEDYDLACEYLS